MEAGAGFARDWAIILPVLSPVTWQSARDVARQVAHTGLRPSRVGFRLTLAGVRGLVDVEYRKREGRGVCTEVRGVYRLRAGAARVSV